MKGYPIRWRKWIKACISNVHYSIMINEKPQGRFKSTSGIRQGDPISPFLFVLALDYLSRLLNLLEEKGCIKGVVLLSCRDSLISYLQMTFSYL